jgi:hypothetical protein
MLRRGLFKLKKLKKLVEGPTKEKSRQLRSTTVLELMEMLRLEDENDDNEDNEEEEDEADDDRVHLEKTICELKGKCAIVIDDDEDVSNKRRRRLHDANPVEVYAAVEVAVAVAEDMPKVDVAEEVAAAVAEDQPVAKDLPEVDVAEDLQDLGKNMDLLEPKYAAKAKAKAAAKAKGKSKAWQVLHKDSDLPELSDQEIETLYETRPHGCGKCKGKVGCTRSCKDNNTVPFRVPR